jgi:hypothetical protein
MICGNLCIIERRLKEFVEGLNLSFLLLKNLSLAGGYWILISFSGRTVWTWTLDFKTSTGFTDLGRFLVFLDLGLLVFLGSWFSVLTDLDLWFQRKLDKKKVD